MLELPLEVVELVCEYTSVDGLLNLRATHSWLKDIATRAIPVECHMLECPSNNSGESGRMAVVPALRIERKEPIWIGNCQKCWLPQIRHVLIGFLHISKCREAWDCLESLKLHQRVCVKFLQPIQISQEYQQLLDRIGRSEVDCTLTLNLAANENETLNLGCKVTCIRLLVNREMINGFVAPYLQVPQPCNLDLVLDLEPTDEVVPPTNGRDKSEYIPYIQRLYQCLRWKEVELQDADHFYLASVFSKIKCLTCKKLIIVGYTDLSVVSSPIECHATEVTIKRSSFLQIQSFNFPYVTTLKLIDSPDQNTIEHISPNSGVWQNVLPILPQLKHLTIKNLVLWDVSDLCTLRKGLAGLFILETLHTTISFPIGMTHEDFDITNSFIRDLVSNCPSLQSIFLANSKGKPFYNLLPDDIQKLRLSSNSPET